MRGIQFSRAGGWGEDWFGDEEDEGVDESPSDPNSDLDAEVVMRELAALHDRKVPVTLSLSALQGWMLVSALQLALRHPNFPPRVREYVEPVTQALAAEVATTPLLQELVRRGWDAQYDEE